MPTGKSIWQRPGKQRLEVYVNDPRKALLERAKKYRPESSPSAILFEALRVALRVWAQQALLED